MHTVFALLCFVVVIHWLIFPYIYIYIISIRLTSLALWQSNDCPSASKATLMNMDKYFMWIHYERLHNHNKAKHNKTVCIFLGIYCIWSDFQGQCKPFGATRKNSLCNRRPGAPLISTGGYLLGCFFLPTLCVRNIFLPSMCNIFLLLCKHFRVLTPWRPVWHQCLKDR